MLTFFQKINKIFDLLTNKTDENPFPKATYWKMGTSISTMFDRFYEKIKDIDDFSKPLVCKYDPKYRTVQGKNNAYNLYIGDKEVTPIMSYKPGASLTTITQYRRSLCAFNLLFIEEKIKYEKDFVIKGIKAKLPGNIKNLLKSENRLSLVLKLISDSFFTNLQFSRRFSYSIIIEFLIRKNFDFSILKPRNRMFTFTKACGRLNNKTFRVLDLSRDLEKIKSDIKRQGSIGTYIQITKLLDTSFTSVEVFINHVYQEYLRKKNIDEYRNEYVNAINQTNLLNRMQNERSKFKPNIFIDRKNLNLIENNSDLYTDLCLIEGENSQEGLLIKFNEGEAAHIWDVESIKSHIENTTNTEEKLRLSKYISNPKNGIIMKNNYHKSFDRNQWTFDSNGEMIYNNENENYLFNVLKLEKIKIRAEIFDDEIRDFISKRNTERDNNTY